MNKSTKKRIRIILRSIICIPLIPLWVAVLLFGALISPVYLATGLWLWIWDSWQYKGYWKDYRKEWKMFFDMPVGMITEVIVK